MYKQGPKTITEIIQLKTNEAYCSVNDGSAAIPEFVFASHSVRVVSITSPVHLSIHLLQAGVLSKWLKRSSGFSAQRFPLTSPTQCYKKILVPPEIRILASGTLSQTSD